MAYRARLASKDLPEQQRVPVWAGLFKSSFHGEFETIGKGPFEAELLSAMTGPAIVGQASISPVFFSHDPNSESSAGGGKFAIQAVLKGSPFYICGDRRPQVKKPGDVVICDADMSFGVMSLEHCRVATILLPRALMVPCYASTKALQDRFADGANEPNLASRLLFELISGFARGELVEARHATIADAVGALVALALDGANGRRLGEDSARKARLSAIRDHMRATYADPLLTQAVVAEKFGISERHLRRLFAETGRSFREELLAIRLQAALYALSHPKLSLRTVADIAYSVGFSDLSQFNRNFRVRFGVTPSEARRDAIK